MSLFYYIPKTVEIYYWTVFFQHVNQLRQRKQLYRIVCNHEIQLKIKSPTLLRKIFFSSADIYL